MTKFVIIIDMNDIAKKVQVVVFLRAESGTINLLLLKTNEHRGSFWQNVTGSVENGEEFQAAAERELFEETGIRANVIELDYHINFYDRWKRNVSEKTYFAVTDSPNIIIDPSEHDEFKWIGLKNVSKSDYFFETNYHCFLEAVKCLE